MVVLSGGERGEVALSALQWKALLQMAEAFGWRTQGVETNFECLEFRAERKLSDKEKQKIRTDKAGLDGYLCSTNYNWIAEEDAKQFAQALRRAQKEIPLEQEPGAEDALSVHAASSNFPVAFMSIFAGRQELIGEAIRILDWGTVCIRSQTP
ncbi:MAG: hypothetical protein KIS92_07620 [Planctomycetota bacterium]|nr:hypothetical protein [Planctomycetota bacterium]